MSRRAALPVCLALLVTCGALAAGPARADVGPGLPRAAAFRTEDAQRAAAVVAAEDRRITSIRTVSSLARWQGRNWRTPYRLSTATGYTLVLTPRSTPYVLRDLLALAPQTLVRMTDGSYLLSEHIAVMPRATLRLSAPGGLVLRLASGPRGFATLVSLGGRLELLGGQDAPLALTSWDPAAGEPDRRPYDGRAYVRAVGGQFLADHVNASDLGFWSGRTGGIALTGTDRPGTGTIEGDGRTGRATPAATPVVGDVTRQPAGRLLPGQGDPGQTYAAPAQDYVSARISATTMRNDAYGLFVTGANGIQVSDTDVSGSTVAGIVLHRFVTNGVLSRTTSSRNVGDGFTLDRATTGITISESTADANAGSGFRLSGRPLAEGPSAVGSPTGSYGNNAVTGSSASGNGHDGIEVLGGFNVGLQNNRVSGGDMGIVVSGPAERVSITGNQVSRPARHGISLVDGVTGSTVTGNVVDAAATGVYVRGSAVQVKGNTVQRARGHGVSLVGAVTGSEISLNVLAGTGSSALDAARSTGTVRQQDNQTGGWHDTTVWWSLLHKLLQPMTFLWAVIALLVGASAVRGRRRDADRVLLHPYAHQMEHLDPDDGTDPAEVPRVVDLRTPADEVARSGA